MLRTRLDMPVILCCLGLPQDTVRQWAEVSLATSAPNSSEVSPTQLDDHFLSRRMIPSDALLLSHG
jgi:hypothetical protein